MPIKNSTNNTQISASNLSVNSTNSGNGSKINNSVNSSEKQDKNNELNGLTIFNFNNDSWIIVIAIVGGLIVIVIAFYFGIKFGEHRAGKNKSNAISDKSIEKKLKHTESELESAQLEINRLRNRDKIKEMERKIEEEKRYLERMKKGY